MFVSIIFEKTVSPKGIEIMKYATLFSFEMKFIYIRRANAARDFFSGKFCCFFDACCVSL